MPAGESGCAREQRDRGERAVPPGVRPILADVSQLTNVALRARLPRDRATYLCASFIAWSDCFRRPTTIVSRGRKGAERMYDRLMGRSPVDESPGNTA